MMEIEWFNCADLFDEFKLQILNCGNAKVDPTWHGEVICSAFSRLYYVKKSSFYIIKNNKRTEFTQGNWYLIPAGSSHEFGCDEESEHLFFHFNLSGADQTDIFSYQTDMFCLSGSVAKALEISELLSSNKVTDALKIKNIVMNLLLKFIKEHNIGINSKKYSPCITKAIDYINSNLSENLTISTVAEAIFVSKSTLTKHMRKELSTSVNHYINDLILTRAAQMITRGNMSLNAISEHFGFCDQFYFSRKFKAKFGVSPSEYKKSNI